MHGCSYFPQVQCLLSGSYIWWLKLRDMGVKEKMWRVVKGMYEVSRSAVLLDGVCLL